MDQDQDDLLLDASDSDIIVPLGGGHQCDPHPAPCVPMIGEILFGLSQSPSEYSFHPESVFQPQSPLQPEVIPQPPVTQVELIILRSCRAELERVRVAMEE